LDVVERLQAIPGRPVSAYEAGDGCVFAARCPHVTDRARRERPQLRSIGAEFVACHRAEELSALGAELEHEAAGR
jgi:ABC-type dipeptide/oligopeptide/nickel transport system ATPase component